MLYYLHPIVVRLGWVWLGKAWIPWRGLVRRCKARRGGVRFGMARPGNLGVAWLGSAVHGRACYGPVRSGKEKPRRLPGLRFVQGRRRLLRLPLKAPLPIRAIEHQRPTICLCQKVVVATVQSAMLQDVTFVSNLIYTEPRQQPIQNRVEPCPKSKPPVSVHSSPKAPIF